MARSTGVWLGAAVILFATLMLATTTTVVDAAVDTPAKGRASMRPNVALRNIQRTNNAWHKNLRPVIRHPPIKTTPVAPVVTPPSPHTTPTVKPAPVKPPAPKPKPQPQPHRVTPPPVRPVAPTTSTSATPPTTTETAAPSTPVDPASLDAFRKPLMEFLDKYKGATEGDSRFHELFPRIEQDRKNMPGYTTCVTFQNLAIGYATSKSGKKLRTTPNVNFFEAQLRRKNHIPPNSFLATLPRGKTLAQASADKTATYVDLKDPQSPRPQPGDLFLLAFSRDQSPKLKAGYFSHIGFVTSITKRQDGKEEWHTVAGGGGSARNKQEKVTEGVMVVDPTTGLTGPVDNQPGLERKLQGWISLSALLQ